MRKHIWFLACLSLSSCALAPVSVDEIPPNYVSPLKYVDESCSQLSEILSNKKKLANQFKDGKFKKTMRDGKILNQFHSNGKTYNYTILQYGELEGEIIALEKAMVVKECKN